MYNYDLYHEAVKLSYKLAQRLAKLPKKSKNRAKQIKRKRLMMLFVLASGRVVRRSWNACIDDAATPALHKAYVDGYKWHRREYKVMLEN